MIDISLAVPPQLRVPEYARVAEALGCRRIWVYDSPGVYGDAWVALARAAEATSTIGLATGVAVPVMRHPMVTAAAIATIEELAPGRLLAAFGTGYTARRVVGQRPMKWADLATFVRQLRGLLDGETVEIDGQACAMLHMPGYAPARPIRTPLWLAPMGPKGFATSAQATSDGVIDGVVVAGVPTADTPAAWDEMGLLMYGTVLGDGEDHTTERVVEAAGPWCASGFHSIWEFAPSMIGVVPGTAEWFEGVVAARPEAERHLAVHEGHSCALTDRDRAGIAAAGEALLATGWTGTPAAVAERARAAEAAGVTELVFAATGPDIPGELERMIAAVRG